MRALILLSLFLGSTTATAAPHPATASSVLTDPALGLSWQSRGYTLKTEGTDWLPVANNKESLLDTVRFGPKAGDESGSLSVRMDKISDNTSLEIYAKKFMRDYPHYGFDVLGSKAININDSRGLVVDMVQKVKSKQLRQVILKNKEQVAILTCIDDKDKFMKTITSCNQLIKSFRWSE